MDKITTNSYRVGGISSLSTRLVKLNDLYDGQEYIWDIGCDHGQLGLSFSDESQVKSIHLVDPSELVINELKKSLEDSYITSGKVFIYHSFGQDLKLNKDSNCIFIAGMGGKEIGEIIQSLLPQINADSKIIISPHRKILELRKILSLLPLELDSEEVIEENGQYYQILAMRPGEGSKRVPLYGESLWEGITGSSYRDHQIQIFSRHRDQESKNYVNYLMKLTY